MDCNFKKLANLFKFLLCILEKLLETDYGLFFLEEYLDIFVLGAGL